MIWLQRILKFPKLDPSQMESSFFDLVLWVDSPNAYLCNKKTNYIFVLYNYIILE